MLNYLYFEMLVYPDLIRLRPLLQHLLRQWRVIFRDSLLDQLLHRTTFSCECYHKNRCMFGVLEKPGVLKSDA